MSISLYLRANQATPLTDNQLDTNWTVIKTAIDALQAGGGSGSVTSVSSGSFSPLFTVSVTNPTTTPSIAFSAISTVANRVYASPNGSSGTPSFRALVENDLPTISVSKIAAVTASRALVSDGSGNMSASSVTATELGYLSGVTSAIQTQLNAKEASINILSALKGGTGVNASGATNGQILIGNGSGFSLATLTAGSNVTITNASGGITIAAGGGISSLNGLTGATQTFAAGSAGTTFAISSAGTAHTFNIPNAGTGITRGLVTNLAQTIQGQKTFSSKPILSALSSQSVLFTNTSGEIDEDADFSYEKNTVGCLEVPIVQDTNQATLTATASLDDTYSYIRSEQAAAAQYTLPEATALLVGREYFFKDSIGHANSRHITVRAFGSDKIDNSSGATKVINTNYGFLRVRCVDLGSSAYGWEVIGLNGVS